MHDILIPVPKAYSARVSTPNEKCWFCTSGTANCLKWTRYAMQVRDRTMADNLDWVRSRLGPRGRVLVFAATGHLASTVVQIPEHFVSEMVPLGAYIKDRYESDFINILNVIVNGEIKYCSASPAG